MNKSLNEEVKKLYRRINENREKIMEAFIAETGLLPSECEMVEQDTRWWIRKRRPEHRRLYYHKTDGGAEYLTDKYKLNPDGSKEGVFQHAGIIIRIDGDICKNAEIVLFK